MELSSAYEAVNEQTGGYCDFGILSGGRHDKQPSNGSQYSDETVAPNSATC